MVRVFCSRVCADERQCMLIVGHQRHMNMPACAFSLICRNIFPIWALGVYRSKVLKQ